MQQTTLESRIQQLIEPALLVLGYEVVRIRYLDGERSKTLQVMLDRADGTAIHVDDCEVASRQISAALDVEDPITERYHLEVSSPGLDRPLTRLKDFESHQGLVAKIETIEKIDDRRRFTGRLVGVEEGSILITTEVVPPGAEEVEAYAIPFDQVLSAKLVMNDELLALAGLSTGKKKTKNKSNK